MSWFVACKSPRPSSYLLSVLVSGGCGVSCNGFLTRSICQSLCPSLDQWQPLSHLRDQSHTCPSPSPLPPIFNSTFFIIRHLLSQLIRSDTGVVYKNTFPEYFLSSDVPLSDPLCVLAPVTSGGVLMMARYTLTSSQRGPGAGLPVLRKPQKSIFTLQTIFVICFNSEAKRGFENQWTKQNLNDSINLRRY